METEIDIDSLQEKLDNLRSEFENYSGFKVRLISDPDIQDYHGKSFTNQKFVVEYDRTWGNSPTKSAILSVDALIDTDGELQVNVYEDHFEEVGFDFSVIWRALFWAAI